jgi:osmotically-inducible protein OsmY
VVTLAGCVRTAEERRRAELDAWCLFAVDRVVNRIEVRG